MRLRDQEIYRVSSEQIVTLEKLRDELVKNALQIRRGDITPNEGNAIANSLKGAIQAEESRLRRDQGILVTAEPQTMELSQDSKNKLDEIAQLMKKSKKKGGR